MKIFDTFLFFQELDLLEIRLEYLYTEVDFFIILEFSQKFNGEKKEFVFEKNKKRFHKYLNKILYFKVDEIHNSYASIKNYLNNSDYSVDQKILEFLDSHEHYSKKDLNWVLDAFQKEFMHHFYSLYIKDTDLVIFSDLDEIPSISFLNTIKNDPKLNSYFFVANQIEFKYFTNLMSSNIWLGSIAGMYSNMSIKSLNDLRRQSKLICKEIAGAGFHFTSCGGEALLISKINSWGHQEYNYPFLKKTALNRVTSGYDAFARQLWKINKVVSLDNRVIFDSKITRILTLFPHLTVSKLTHFSILDRTSLICVYFLNILIRIKMKLKKYAAG